MRHRSNINLIYRIAELTLCVFRVCFCGFSYLQIAVTLMPSWRIYAGQHYLQTGSIDPVDCFVVISSMLFSLYLILQLTYTQFKVPQRIYRGNKKNSSFYARSVSIYRFWYPWGVLDAVAFRYHRMISNIKFAV